MANRARVDQVFIASGQVRAFPILPKVSLDRVQVLPDGDKRDNVFATLNTAAEEISFVAGLVSDNACGRRGKVLQELVDATLFGLNLKDP